MTPNGSPRCAMIRNLDYKLVFRPLGVSELYDLKKDQRQLTNLWGSADYAQVQGGLMMNLTQWFVLTGGVTPVLLDDRGLPPQYTEDGIVLMGVE